MKVCQEEVVPDAHKEKAVPKTSRIRRKGHAGARGKVDSEWKKLWGL